MGVIGEFHRDRRTRVGAIATRGGTDSDPTARKPLLYAKRSGVREHVAPWDQAVALGTGLPSTPDPTIVLLGSVPLVMTFDPVIDGTWRSRSYLDESRGWVGPQHGFRRTGS